MRVVNDPVFHMLGSNMYQLSAAGLDRGSGLQYHGQGMLPETRHKMYELQQ
jgi:hypothetical protein